MTCASQRGLPCDCFAPDRMDKPGRREVIERALAIAKRRAAERADQRQMK